MKDNCTVLISSAGRRVELLQCFRRDAADLGIAVRVLAADHRPAWSPACHVADAAFAVPRCDDPGFVPQMLALCATEKVDLVVPTIDPELLPLSQAQARFAEIGTRVAVSSPEVVALARDKLATARHLAAAGIAVPATATLDEVAAAPEAWRWPLLVKPRGGSASAGIRRLESPDQLEALNDPAGLVAQALLEGPEYTVNLFFDQAGALRCAVPHQRVEIRAGEVAKGVTRRHERLEAVARRLAGTLDGARGALCLQAIVDDAGEPQVFELNARFGGGFPLAHRAGAPFSRWLLEEATGRPSTCGDGWRDGTVMLRYDAAVFTSEANLERTAAAGGDA